MPIDYRERLVSFFGAWWRGQPLLDAVLTSKATQLQASDNELQTVANPWAIYSRPENPSIGGVQLDNLGELFGVDRLGLTDTQYRQALIAASAVNASQGRIVDTTNWIKRFVLFLVGGFLEPKPYYIPQYPAGFIYDIIIQVSSIPYSLHRFATRVLQGVAPSGVESGGLVIWFNPSENTQPRLYCTERTFQPIQDITLGGLLLEPQFFNLGFLSDYFEDLDELDELAGTLDELPIAPLLGQGSVADQELALEGLSGYLLVVLGTPLAAPQLATAGTPGEIAEN